MVASYIRIVMEGIKDWVVIYTSSRDWDVNDHLMRILNTNSPVGDGINHSLSILANDLVAINGIIIDSVSSSIMGSG